MEESLYFNPIRFDSEKTLPPLFNFPFNHDPNEVSLLAAEHLKKELKTKEFNHNFNLLGKMFGVLIVERLNGEFGFLKAYSGKLDNNFSPIGYVPPVFDVHHKDGFFKVKEKLIEALTEEIAVLESSSKYLSLEDSVLEKRELVKEALVHKKQYLKSRKEDRKKQRALYKDGSSEHKSLNESLNEQSKKDQIVYKKEKRDLKKELNILEDLLQKEKNIITDKKSKRKAISSQLQHDVFENYSFLNTNKEEKNLIELFEETAFKLPPSGAGECCAPRLLQYAHINNLRPVCFTEFWWGASPDSEVRVHNQHYPACRGKCAPILKHMLEGVSVEANPLNDYTEIDMLNVLYEDNAVVVVDKPAGILSVPGKEMSYSLTSLIKAQFPNIEGPGLVHRLDYETSGIVLVAKNLDHYRVLQKQFESRTIKKKYVALLQNPLEKNKGEIDLPLRVDIYNRPRQLVCFEHGKKAITEYEQVNHSKKGARVEFFPITGRTHQLRVHSAHKSGLNNPILGDSLYGTSNQRLYLHATMLVFKHPVSGEEVKINSKVPF